jgi:hypothetical protein
MKERKKKSVTINQRSNERTNETLVRIDHDDGLNLFDFRLNLFDFREEMRLLGGISGFEKCAQELVSHAIHHMESSPEGLHRNHNYINLLPWCAMDHVHWSARRHQTSHSRRRRRRRKR